MRFGSAELDQSRHVVFDAEGIEDLPVGGCVGLKRREVAYLGTWGGGVMLR
jgi:hypothetical protein